MIAEDFEVRDHRHHFAGSFAISPTCMGLEKSVFTARFIVFVGDHDDAAVDVTACEALHDREQAPIKVIEFKGVTHGYEDVGGDRVFHGWRMKYDPGAEKFTMKTIFELLKSKDFKAGMEYR